MALPRHTRGPMSHLSETSVRRHGAEEMDTEEDSIPSSTRTKMGILSQTLITSPIIQGILPARLRHDHHNDVVFVGERSLQVKEAVSEPDSGVHLEPVTSKFDFDAQIMASKVINVSTELPWETQMTMDGSSSSANTTPGVHHDLPPQILCLSLGSRELVFLYYSVISEQFIHYRRPLPSDVSTFERFGRNIAVEPRYEPFLRKLRSSL